MGFYQVLNEIMEERNMSIPEVARACDLPDSTIRSIMARESQTVKLDVAFKISEGLNVSLERLNGDPEPVQTDIQEMNEIFLRLSEDNRSKLIELAHLYLDAQRNNGEK